MTAQGSGFDRGALRIERTVMEDDKPLSDAEMIALAAIAQVDAAEVSAANAKRIDLGQSMAYDGCDSAAAERLRRELTRRGIL